MRYKGIDSSCRRADALEKADKVFDLIATESSFNNETPPSYDLCSQNCKSYRPSRKSSWEGKCAAMSFEKVIANSSFCLLERRK